MAESTRNPSSIVTVATAVHTQAVRYTDARYDVLSARMDAIQVAIRHESERTETHKARCKFIGDGTCALSAAILAVGIDHLASIPHIAAILLGSLPAFAQVTFEFVRKL